MKSSGLLSESANVDAGHALQGAIEQMKSESYMATRDPLGDVIPTAAHLLPRTTPQDSKQEIYTYGKSDRKTSSPSGDTETGMDEEESELRLWRAERAAALKRKVEQAAHHGGYCEITEDEFFRVVLRTYGGSDCAVIHFFHPKFSTCEKMDRLLSLTAPEMRSIRFVKINAEKSPFLTDKLGVTVLPCVVFFRDDNCIDRMVGWEECGSTDPSIEQFRDLLLQKLRLD